ncbi:hypothetical protein FDUTEX481_10080 [Tolypothrix sp. PCC 7601]|nr:hypothetical protein FDUTEX481_10080 [Tolypothrix sp. PCC 7601]
MIKLPTLYGVGLSLVYVADNSVDRLNLQYSLCQFLNLRYVWY